MRTIGRLGVVTIAILGALLLLGATAIVTYNKLVRLDQAAKSQWAQVESAYQRRADLVPNLVATVKGAAAFERDTLAAVTDARARIGQLRVPDGAAAGEPAFRSYQQAQDELGAALGRLIAVAEAYPQLTATASFRDLQAQLEGTENRIAVERMRYNEAARDFDTARASFPTSMIAAVFGARFAEKPYFTAVAGSQTAPKVEL